MNAYVENQASVIRIYLNGPRNLARKLLNTTDYNNIGKQTKKNDCYHKESIMLSWTTDA